MIDLSLYNPEVTIFKGCAKCCRLGFVKMQDGHRQPELVWKLSMIPLVTRIQKMYSLTYLGRTVFEFWVMMKNVFERSKVTFRLHRVTFLKLVRFGWKWSQNVSLVLRFIKRIVCLMSDVSLPLYMAQYNRPHSNVLILTYLSLLSYQRNTWHRKTILFWNLIYHSNILRPLSTKSDHFYFSDPCRHACGAQTRDLWPGFYIFLHNSQTEHPR